MSSVYIMAYRQLKRFMRSRSRIVSSIVSPIIWIVFFGLGWSGAFNFPMARALFGGVDYLTYLTPGVVAMTVFAASFVGGVSVLWDKQFGFLKEVLVAPMSRSGALLGRALGDTITAVLQGVIILGLSYLVAPGIKVAGALPAIAFSFVLGLGFTALGIVVALKMTSMEGFHMIMNFLTLPLIFLSGAFYPITFMPTWMKMLAYANPLTYSVDGIRYCLTGISYFNPVLDVAILVAMGAVLLGVACYMFEKTTIE